MSARQPRTAPKPSPNSQKAPRTLTKRQLSRHEREVRNQRIAIITVAVALAIALIVPLYGLWREVIAKGGEPIAVVNGKQISTELFARFLGYEDLLLQREAKRLSTALAATTDTTLQQSIQLQLQILQQRASSLPDESLDYLIEQPLIVQEAAKRGLSASPEGLDVALQQEMTAYSLGGLAYQSLTDVSADQLLTVEQARTELKAIVASAQFLTEDEVRDLILTQRVLRSRILAALTEGLPTSGEQVHARHILVETEEAAAAARARIVAGEDFAAVAKEVTTDTSSKEVGGDLGWFTRDAMIEEFSTAAFALGVGELSQPVKTTYGYHLIKIDEKAADRAFEKSYLDQQKATKFSDWLSEQKAVGAVEKLDSQDKLTWADSYISDRFPTTQ